MLLSLEDSSAIHWNQRWDFVHGKALLRKNILLVLDWGPTYWQRPSLHPDWIFSHWHTWVQLLLCLTGFTKGALKIQKVNITACVSNKYKTFHWNIIERLFARPSDSLAAFSSCVLIGVDYFVCLYCSWLFAFVITLFAADRLITWHIALGSHMRRRLPDVEHS